MRTDITQDRPLTILYEDEQLLVCVKPSGVLSAKDASGQENLCDLLAPRQVFPVHRLDREVSGLMVFAKTKAAAAFLSRAMQEDFEKEYLTLCEGCPQPAEGLWTDLLYHDRVKNKTYVVKRERKGVKEARLEYTVLRAGKRSLVRVRLLTGRTHQIRVQFASRGCPLMGDRRYGAASDGAMGLCCYALSFPHPQGQRLSFTLPDACLPKEFSEQRS